MSLRATQAIIDLSAIRKNIKLLQQESGPDTRLLAVVKGDAYGLGAVPICRMMEQAGVYYLGIATLNEALALRKARINLPILMFTEGFVTEHLELLQNTVTQTVFSFEKAKEIDTVAAASSKQSTIHLKVDTGMGRVGCPYEEAVDIVRQIRRLRYTCLEGIYTHFPVADECDSEGNHAFTLAQIEKMNRLREQLEHIGIHVPLFHCANSGGVMNFPSSCFDMVRIGISAYGYHPSVQGRRMPLHSALTFKTKVIFVKRVAAGTPISYGRTYITSRPSTIATLPVGYADGYPRALSNKGRVIIRGRSYPIAGRVCMDMFMVNCGDDPVEVEDDAILYGTMGKESFTVEDAARLLDTIPYELICRIAPRVPRIAVGEEGTDTVDWS